LWNGAYQEVIRLGQSPRSTDGTIDIIKKFVDNKKVFHIEANEQSDAQQRNIGLQKIKELKSDWLFVADGDEVWEPNMLTIVKNYCNLMEKNNQYAAYVCSLTFVMSQNFFTYQKFPRLFKITDSCMFVNDNFMLWPDKNIYEWKSSYVIDLSNILKFYHYAFCKNLSRFDAKKQWWESRFGDSYMGTGKKFEYDWFVENNEIKSKTHKILEFKGKHPKVMKEHPLFKKR
jgi:hypothetical protein